MDVLNALSARARRLGGRLPTDSASDNERDSENSDDLERAYRLLRLVKLLLVIVATALTIAQMLGWL